MVQMLDRLQSFQPCQPVAVRPAATPHPLEPELIKQLVDEKLIGPSQVKVAIEELQAKGADLTVVRAVLLPVAADPGSAKPHGGGEPEEEPSAPSPPQS